MRRKLIAGNWKMNGSLAALAELDAIAEAARANPQADVAICPPFTLIAPAVERAPNLAIGAQDCHGEPSGAHTGNVSAVMLLSSRHASRPVRRGITMSRRARSTPPRPMSSIAS